MVKREKHIWHLNFFSVQQSSWQLLYPYGRSWPRTKKGNKVETYSYKIKPAHTNAHSFILIILCYGIVLLNHEKRNNDLDSLSIKDMVEEQSRISKVSFKSFESFKKNLFRILKNWKAVKSQRWRRWEQNFTKVTFIWLMCFQLLEIKACKEKCGREFEAIQKQVWQRGCLGTLVDNVDVLGRWLTTRSFGDVCALSQVPLDWVMSWVQLCELSCSVAVVSSLSDCWHSVRVDESPWWENFGTSGAKKSRFVSEIWTFEVEICVRPDFAM